MKPVHGRILEDYLATVRRRWVVMVLGLVVALGAGVGYLQLAEKSWVASAKVLVERTDVDPAAERSRTTDSINLDTEAQLVKSARVATRAAEVLGTSMTSQELAKRVTVTVPPNTTVLLISFTADTPELARDGAQAFADVYLERRAQVAQSAIADSIAAYESAIANTRDEIGDINTELKDEPSAATRELLAVRREALSVRLASLTTGLSTLSATVVRPGVVINEAQVPSSPASPKPMLILPSALFLGLVVGLGLAMWRERRDVRVHSATDLDRFFGLTPLAELKGTVGTGATGESIHFDVRALYHSVRAYGPDGGAEVVLVFGPDAPDTADRVAEALGVVAARSGATTTHMSAADDPDASDARRKGSGGVLRDLHYSRIGLVADGEVNAEKLQAQVRTLREESDFVVLGLPSNDPNVDLPMLARHVDLVLMLVQLGRSTRPSVGEAMRTLTTGGARAVFAATVDLGRRRRGHRERRSVRRRKADQAS